MATLSKIQSPSVFFKIDPTGEMEVLASYDKIQVRNFVNVACRAPQTSIPNLNLESICSDLAKVLYYKGLFGYFTLDLIVFPDPTKRNGQKLFWAIGLDCFLGNYSSACVYF